MRKQFVGFVWLFCGATACTNSTASRPGGVDRPDLSIQLQADRTVVLPGDTVRFTVIARNMGPARIQVGVQCGPAMDVQISKPGGGVISVLNAQFENAGLPVAFTCELGPYHFADARDSLVNRLWWKAPDARGSYVAVAGARGSTGLDDLSTVLSITVK